MLKKHSGRLSDMKILVTGSKGFVGRNLVESLKCIRDGKDRRTEYQSLLPLTIYEYDREDSEEELAKYCRDADFVFNLAGVNRPKNTTEFADGNTSFVRKLLSLLEVAGNTCPVMLSSSQQATKVGRYEGSIYGQSKLDGEILLQEYCERTGARALIYRFPNLYGKWCRPNYNSAVATFCYNLANDLPIQVNDREVELELLFIDDLVSEMLQAALGNPSRTEEQYCEAGPTAKATVGQIVDTLQYFKATRKSLEIPDLTSGSFSKKLYSTFLSYFDPRELSYEPRMNVDSRGSFTELFKSVDRGQVSVNISRPGEVKGQHWHHSKVEKFCVVSGQGLVQIRKVGTGEKGQPFEVVEYPVSGDKITIIDLIPGYSHNIANTSATQDLVTIVWCNEIFDINRPDTFSMEV